MEISCRRDFTVLYIFDRSSSNSAFFFLKRSLCAWTIGKRPDPPPTGSPARIASIVLADAADWSNPEIIDDVGDVPLRDGGCSLELLYAGAADTADEGYAAAAACCCTRRRSFSSVTDKLRDFSSSCLVCENSERNDSSWLWRSRCDTRMIVSSLFNFLFLAKSNRSSDFSLVLNAPSFASLTANSSATSPVSSSSPVENSIDFATALAMIFPPPPSCEKKTHLYNFKFSPNVIIIDIFLQFRTQLIPLRRSFGALSFRLVNLRLP